MRLDKSQWAMGLAYAVSLRCEDPYVQVGAVALREDWSVIGVGYNGLPAGVNVPPEFWDDRDRRRPYMIHAEVNALRYAKPGEVYRVVTTHISCPACMSVLGSYQVAELYYHQLLGEAYDNELISSVAALNRIWVRPIIEPIVPQQQETANDDHVLRWA